MYSIWPSTGQAGKTSLSIFVGVITLWLCIIILFIPTQLLGQGSKSSPADLALEEALALDGKSDYRGAKKKYLVAREYYRKSADWNGYCKSYSYLLNAMSKLAEFNDLEIERKIFEQELDSISQAFPSFDVETIRRSSDQFHFLSLKEQNRYLEAEQLLLSMIDETDTLIAGSDFYKKELIKLYLLGAELYLAKGSYQQSIEFSQYALNSIHNWNFTEEYEAQGVPTKAHQYIASAYLMLGEDDKVQEQFAVMMELSDKLETKNEERNYGVFKQIFEYFLSREDLEQAERYISKLSDLEYAQQRATDLMIFESQFAAAFDSFEISSQKLEKARLAILKKMNVTHASYLENRRMLLAGLLREKQHLRILDEIRQIERDIEMEVESTSQLPDFMDIRAIKAAALFALYETGDQERLEAAWKEIRLCTHQIQEIRRSHQSDSDKVKFLGRSYRIFEQALIVCHAQYQQKNDQSWVDSAFSLMEGSKALNLLEGLLHRQATNFAGVDPERIAAETDMRMQIAGLQARLNSSEIQLSDRVTEQIAARKLDLVRAYDSLIVVIEKAHPEFYNLRHESPVPSMDIISKQLMSENRGFLEFFLGEKELFTLVISNGLKKLYRKSWPDTGNQLVTRHLNSITAYDRFPTFDTIATFLESGFELYNLIFEPIDLSLPERITIIPDGILNYISFAALPAKRSEDLNSWFSDTDYLINQYAFSYAYSASMLSEVNRTKRNSEGMSVFAVAPSFRDFPLSHNEEEINEIGKLCHTEKLKGDEATRGIFLEILRGETNKDILHLSTHGVANKKTGTESYLRFTETIDTSTSKLFAWELYNLRLPFSLCFLSACETSDGELQKGEGIVSLAQGFFYAGVKSMVTTLWSIGDKTSVEIVTGFYKNLKKGETKDVALRHTQLSYLKKMIKGQKKNKCHPVYWAAFIAVGDMSSMAVINPFGWIGDWRFWLVICGIIGAISLMLFRRRSQ